jgi:hypothetical protein
LTVPLEGAEKVDSDTGRLAVRATGDPPPGTTDLLTADGRRVVSVQDLPGKECDGLSDIQAVGTEPDSTWCLGLDGIPDGSQVAGKLGGAMMTLSLTVTRRSSFWATPLAVIVGGIIVGLLAVLIPVSLRRTIRRRLLDRALEENRGREGSEIVDLDDWVTTQRAAGAKDDELLPIVTRVMEEAPGIAERGRNALRDRLLGSTLLPRTCAYRRGAEEFFSEHKALKVVDFISEGKLTGAYPSAEWIVGLETLERQWGEVGRFGEAIEKDPSGLEDARRKLTEAEEALMAVDRPESVAGAVEKVDGLRVALGTRAAAEAKFLAPVENRGDFLAMATSRLSEGASRTADRPPERLRAERPAVRAGRLWPYVLCTVLLVAAALVFSVASVEHSVFAPAKAFGGFDEYFALFSAAVAAGTGSSVIGLLSPWDGREPSEA